MELDEMKTRWKELSLRLEKQQILSRNNLENAVCRFRRSISAYLWFNIVTGVAAFPLCIGIALWRDLIGLSFVWIGLAGVVINLLFALVKIVCFRRIEQSCSDITEQTLLGVRYQQLRICAAIFDYAFVTAYLGRILLSRWELFTSDPVTILLTVAILASAGGGWVYRWESTQIKALVCTLRDLREFSKE